MFYKCVKNVFINLFKGYTTIACESSSGFLILIDTIMEENVITGIVIAGNIYNVMANGVKCPQCAVKDLCLRGKLGSKVQFDCASIHLEKAS